MTMIGVMGTGSNYNSCRYSTLLCWTLIHQFPNALFCFFKVHCKLLVKVEQLVIIIGQVDIFL